MRGAFTRVIGEVLDVLVPPMCASCGAPARGRPAVFCASCLESVEHAPGPVPSPVSTIDVLHVPFLYGGPITRAILRFKHGGLPALGSRLADMALDLGAPRAPDLLVPVPLHRARLASRGFNQACVIARRVGRLLGVRPRLGLLVRVRDTPSQGGLSRDGRRANVRGAFALTSPAAQGRSVLLVDDVWTTGATAGECARILLGAGARSVGVFTLARVG
jgi:ComF family protein